MAIFSIIYGYESCLIWNAVVGYRCSTELTKKLAFPSEWPQDRSHHWDTNQVDLTLPLSIFHFGRAKLHLHINQIHAFDGVKFLYRNPAQKSVVCLFAKCRHIWFSDISARSHQIGKWKWNKITFQCGILVREAIFRVLTAISDPDLIYVNCRFP